MRCLWLVFAWLLLLPVAPAALACGADSDCMIGNRSYRIRLPEAAPSRRVGALVFIHGHRGHAADIIEDADLAAALDRLGLALIAPQSDGPGWRLPHGPGWSVDQGDPELGYFDRLVADVTTRFPVDPARIVAGGMSAGGMMVWELACYRPERFAGFIPVSGTFWLPLPQDCRPPPHFMRHIHGTEDPTVPLAGRRIREAKQGDVFEAIALFAANGRFGPPLREVVDGQDCAMRTNAAGDALSLCLHPGAHDYRVPDIVSALRALAVQRGW